MKPKFTVGQAVRYKPGSGTYGYEDALEDDGRVGGIVEGYSPKPGNGLRVRVTLTLAKRGGQLKKIAVAETSLTAVVESVHVNLGPAVRS